MQQKWISTHVLSHDIYESHTAGVEPLLQEQDVRSPPNFAMSATSFLNFTNPVEFVDFQACHFG